MVKRLVTPEYARALIEECTHDKSLMETLMRPIRPHHVAYLARQMERGAFGNNLIDIAYCHETGQRFIVNGNHTLRAIIKANARLHLTVENTECETVEDVRLAYSRYDRGLGRTRADAMRALNASNGLAVPLSYVGYLASAVAFMLDDYRKEGSGRLSQTVGDDELYEEALRWRNEYECIRQWVGGAKAWEARVIRRRGVLSVALVTARANPDKAREFWQGVVTGANIPYGSPALRLRDFLMETGVRGGARDGGKVADTDEIAKTVAYCWEKFVANRLIKQLKVPAGPVSVRFSSV